MKGACAAAKQSSLLGYKDDANEVLVDFECGIGIEGFTSFEEKDIISKILRQLN